MLTEEYMVLSWFSRTTILVDVLPQQFTHFGVQPNFALFLPFPKHLDVVRMHIRQAQVTKLGDTHPPVQPEQQHHIITEACPPVGITCRQQLLNALRSKGCDHFLRSLRLHEAHRRTGPQQVLHGTPLEERFDDGCVCPNCRWCQNLCPPSSGGSRGFAAREFVVWCGPH